MSKRKIFRIAAVPVTLSGFLKGQLRFLNKYFDIYAVASPGSAHSDIHKGEGVGSFEINIERRINMRKDLISLFKLYHLFRREKPDIIHSMTPKAGLLSMTAGFFARVPIRIHTFTGLIFPSEYGFMCFLLKTMDCLTCLFATKIIPEGQGVKNDLINNWITRKPLEVIGNGNVNGIDTKYFSKCEISEDKQLALCSKLDVNKNHIVYIFVGRIVGDKGINELVAAFSRLYEFDDLARLLLVGPFEKELDPLLPLTEEKIINHPGIIWVGYQEDVRPFFAISDVFILPSYREGFPNAVMQAGAMDLPCIVTNINGSNEIIEDGHNGIIIPPKDVEALYAAMKDLFVNKEKRKMLTLTARQNIIDRYERQFVWDELLKEYESLLNEIKE
ncbi:glycosyltransferase family 4 protein [Ancylomarina sp. 16SWW S1-10-2]|uniref:glycosyltransferase family 4 protein n=1 Tax=Ancylomarina sp. 16SWW S1-10-2 TaxID=2499681 RepID=UPI001E60DCD2|nr:glycosyltransferase family 4 protein [Ancylomarina sp. 16SWW S1-10-2]